VHGRAAASQVRAVLDIVHDERAHVDELRHDDEARDLARVAADGIHAAAVSEHGHNGQRHPDIQTTRGDKRQTSVN
jgi:hypothetical protein